jgi:alkylation response protein AidB-like acyl-CoA dehydrogenase
MLVSGIHASGTTFISFDSVRVPTSHLLGKPGGGLKIILSNFNPERLSLSIGALAMARTCYTHAFTHACRRKTFGKPLIENGVIRAKLAGMVRGVESTRAWVESIAWEMKVMKLKGAQNPSTDQGIGAKLALAKVQAGKVRFLHLQLSVSNMLTIDRPSSTAAVKPSKYLAVWATHARDPARWWSKSVGI